MLCDVRFDGQKFGLLQDLISGRVYPEIVASFSVTDPANESPGYRLRAAMVKGLENTANPVAEYPRLCAIEEDRGHHHQVNPAFVGTGGSILN